MNDKTKELKKKAAEKAVALTTAATLLAGGLFSPPADLAPEEDLFSETAVVDTLLPEPEAAGPEIVTVPDEEEKKRQRAPLRIRILRVLGLWIAGAILVSVVSALLSALPAVLAGILSWAAGALITLALAAVAVKLLFPEKSWKEIFSRKNLPLLAGGAAAAGILTAVAEAWLAENPWVKAGAIALGTAAVLAAVLLRTQKREKAEEGAQQNTEDNKRSSD